MKAGCVPLTEVTGASLNIFRATKGCCNRHLSAQEKRIDRLKRLRLDQLGDCDGVEWPEQKWKGVRLLSVAPLSEAYF
jgi:hypothetical protein